MSEVMQQGARDRAAAGPVAAEAGGVTLTAIVAAVFARVLRHASVEARDDFFDLGGDSILAIALMAELHAATGQDLPMTAIYDAPTPAAMAALLAASAPRARTSCLVPLRPGCGTPLFIAHGLGGSVMELRDLAQRLDTDGAVYGIEARGLDGCAEPLDRIEDMAAFHLQEIRRVQPAGPYRLAGFSFGGLVALEMAQQLTRAGETVAFLGMLDTYPHSRFWPLRCRAAAWARLARFWLSPTVWRRVGSYYGAVLRGLPPGERLAYVVERAWRAAAVPFDIFHASKVTHRLAGQSGLPGQPKGMATPVVRRVQRAGEAAFAAYRPAAYAGEIVFVKAAGETVMPFEARTLWRALARTVTVHTVPANHQALVRSGAAPLAAVLSAALRRIGEMPAPREAPR